MNLEMSTAVKRILKELKSLQESPMPGLAFVHPCEDNVFKWEVAFFGPPECPYFGGYYKVKFI